MKRFGYFLVLFFAIAGFFAPVGVQVTFPDSSHSLSNHSLSSLSFSVEPSIAHGAFISTICPGQEGGSSWSLESARCSIADGILNIFEVIWFQVTQIGAAITAVLVDFFLIHSISSQTYTSGIIEAGWEILRDFVNIVFIFALLIIAFNIVLGRNDSKNKSALLKTLLIALVINFSLFVTYAVVDSSNIFARVFYNKIEATGGVTGYKDAGVELAEFFSGYSGVKSPSVAILSAFNPQQMIGDGQTPEGIGFFGSFTIIFFAGLINILIIYIFISIMLFFLGRTVGIMLLGIFAPLAFASLTIPGFDGMKWVGFSSWWKQLLSLAFMAPVYLFLLYVTITFATNTGLKASISNIGGGSQSIISLILSVVLPFALIAILLMTTLKVTKSMAGELGGIIIDFAKKGIGGAVAVGAVVATGGAAAAGGALRGAGAIAGQSSGAGRSLSSLGTSLQATNFNFAQTKLGKFASKQTGINMGQDLGNLSYARADTAVRATANQVRAGISDMSTGRPSAAVEAWETNVQASRDKLTSRRTQNVSRQAVEAAKENARALEHVFDFATMSRVSQTINNLPQRIEELEAERNRRSSSDITHERDTIRNAKNTLNADIQSERDAIKLLEQERQTLLNNGDTATAALRTNAINARRADIRALEDKIRHVEKSSLDQRLSSLKEQLQLREHDARAAMFNEDMNTRYTQQDSSLTFDRERRQERVQRQAARAPNTTPPPQATTNQSPTPPPSP